MWRSFWICAIITLWMLTAPDRKEGGNPESKSLNTARVMSQDIDSCKTDNGSVGLCPHARLLEYTRRVCWKCWTGLPSGISEWELCVESTGISWKIWFKNQYLFLPRCFYQIKYIRGIDLPRLNDEVLHCLQSSWIRNNQGRMVTRMTEM